MILVRGFLQRITVNLISSMIEKDFLLFRVHVLDDLEVGRRVETIQTTILLKWAREELMKMDKRTRKLMTIHEVLHPKDDVDRLYVPRKERGRGLTSIEDNVDASIQRLEVYTEKQRGLITATINDTDNAKTNRMTIIRKQ